MNNLTRLRAKLRLNIDTRWADGTGYRPITIEAVPTPGPAAVDRQIRVTLKPRAQSQRDVSTLIDIPQGSRSVSKTVLVPQDELWHSFSVDVHEEGRKIEELSAQHFGFNRRNYWQWTESSPATLFIDSDVPARAQREAAVALHQATRNDPSPTRNLPDYRNFVRIFPESTYANLMVATDGSNRASDLELLTELQDSARVEMLPPAELPERWLALTSFDMAYISRGDLEALLTNHPKRFEALREWVHAGAVLCVYDVGEKFEHLAELEKLLKLAPRPRGSRQNAEYRGWIEPDFKRRFANLSEAVYGAQVNSYAGSYEGGGMAAPVAGVGEVAVEADSAKKSREKPPETWPFLVRDAGFGYVVAFADDNPFPGERLQWNWMLATIPNEHWMWFRRHGMSMHRANNDFWNFLIPGVGVAPVVSFLLLITLFAAVIGPVNYVVLGRMRRLYLLLITVPVGAAVVTGSLFLYAMVTDGIGVRARIRSFTELDARTGHAVSLSRQSYYASIAPSGGLTFPDDAAVYPLIHEPTSSSGQRAWGQKLHWDEDQHFRAGYLPSRTATQFLVVQAAPTKSRLIVQPQVGGKPPQVTNELGVDIPYLLIADRKTREDQQAAGDSTNRGSFGWQTPLTYWQVESLEAGAKASAMEVSVGEVQERLNRIYRDNAPAYPEGYDPTLHNNAMAFLTGSYSRYVNVDPALGAPSVATGMLERRLARLALKSDAMLEPGMFLAIAESPVEVPLGVEGMRQDQSLHVVHGRW